MSEARDDPVVFLSNRGPVEYGRSDGERTTRRSAGGLVTALSGLAGRLDDAVWVCGALTDEDAVVAGEHDGSAPHGRRRGRPRHPHGGEHAEEQRKFYTVIANPLLWFVQHYLWALSDAPDITRRELDAFDNGYVPANARFTDIVAEESRGGRATVMVQDYHFYLVPEQLRARCPDVFIHHFVHIPWPQPDAWRGLPEAMRE